MSERRHTAALWARVHIDDLAVLGVIAMTFVPLLVVHLVAVIW